MCSELSRLGMILTVGGLLSLSECHFANAEEEPDRRLIAWRTSYTKAAEEAVELEKPILIEFTAVWCGACRQMQQLTFSDRRLVDYVDSAFVPLVLDADQYSDLVSGFRVEAFPTTLVVSPDLKILKRFTGYQSASTLLPGLEQVVREKFAGREVVQPVSATMPVNTQPVAFEGFCLVSILDNQKLRRGTTEFSLTYRDQQVCFQSAEHLKKFQANPAKYWPVANGRCLVSEREGQSEALGDPRVGVTWKGRLWLFSDRDSQKRFIQSPRKYTASGM